MAHFAQLETTQNPDILVVVQNIVAEPDFIATGALGDPAFWVQNSYNTRAGVHILGGEPLRGNFAGIGYLYSKQHDIFYPPQPFASWTLDIPTASWVPPVAYPTDGEIYNWNEDSQSWDAVLQSTQDSQPVAP